MPKHKIQVDLVDELIRWHLPLTPVRPPSRLPGRTRSAPRKWPPAEQGSQFSRPLEGLEQV